MNEERRRGPRGEGWGPPPWAGRGESRKGRAEWEAGPGGPGGPGFGPGRGRGPRGAGRGWGGPGGAWGWAESGPVPGSPPDFGPMMGHLREFHRHGGPGHRRARRGD